MDIDFIDKSQQQAGDKHDTFCNNLAKSRLNILTWRICCHACAGNEFISLTNAKASFFLLSWYVTLLDNQYTDRSTQWQAVSGDSVSFSSVVLTQEGVQLQTCPCVACSVQYGIHFFIFLPRGVFIERYHLMYAQLDCNQLVNVLGFVGAGSSHRSPVRPN